MKRDCRLYIDDTLQDTDNSITENINQNFSVVGFGDGTYNWFVNCTDNSDNSNVGQSPFHKITVQNDPYPPNVTLASPPDNTLETDGPGSGKTGRRPYFFEFSLRCPPKIP